MVQTRRSCKRVHQLELVGATPNYPAALTQSARHLLSAIAAPSPERHAGDEPLSRCNMARAGDSLPLSSPGGTALISSSTIIVRSSYLIATVEAQSMPASLKQVFQPRLMKVSLSHQAATG
jgi:hypothetical protein